jgi:hypothetical protein
MLRLKTDQNGISFEHKRLQSLLSRFREKLLWNKLKIFLEEIETIIAKR